MGGTNSALLEKKTVVVGGGYGGAFLCTEMLDGGANFTLIDEKPFFYHNVATVRAVIEPDMADKLFVPYEKTFGEHFTQGRVKAIKAADKKVVLESGTEVDFDVLVLATGSRNSAPYKVDPEASDPEAHARQLCTDYGEKVKNAKTIVVVGGGAIGVEVAAEINTTYTDKEVTLIHSSEELVIKGATKCFQDNVQKKLKNMRVNLVLGKKVTNLASLGDSGEVQTDDGSTFQADLVMKCTGNTKIDLSYAQGLGSDCFDEKGLLKVNEHLQVAGYENVFAMGDCSNADVTKTAVYAQKHISVVFKNVKAYLTGACMTKYKPDSGPHYDIFVSLGKKDAEGSKGGTRIPAFFIVRAKSKDVMVGEYWKKMKQKAPKV